MKTRKELFAIQAISSVDGSDLGYWSNSNNNISKGNPDTWDILDIFDELERANVISLNKKWKLTFRVNKIN